MTDKTKKDSPHKSFDILGWFLLTLGLAIFLYWAYRTFQPATGTKQSLADKQTFTWTVGGAILLYLIVGLTTFTHREKGSDARSV